ncbi:hypothetical protein [Candidatus Phytoplasma solani]|uniref:hypothetical protein n=1 Tax=Candidatus Phytoplasma solani TaxID=69896 RepID=UPI00041E28C1|nr:hypothetical protein [Candidatus Phytoplasma solani]
MTPKKITKTYYNFNIFNNCHQLVLGCQFIFKTDKFLEIPNPISLTHHYHKEEEKGN